MLAEPKDINHKGKIKNKREYFRLNERLRIEVRKIKSIVKDKATGETKIERIGKVAEHFTNDISAGGLQFFSEGHYRDNTRLEITLHFKETDPHFDPVSVTARIVRAEQVENSRYYNVSVVYINIDSIARSHIERYIFVRQREMIAERRIGYL